MKPTEVLTEEQMQQLKTNSVIDGMTIDSNQKTLKSCAYHVLKTIGFYKLRNVVASLDVPFNVYTFVSDANAPRPLFTANNSIELPDSMYMDNDDDFLFDLSKSGAWGGSNLGSVKLPSNMSQTIQVADPTWNTVKTASIVHHSKKTPVNSGVMDASSAVRISNVFGDLTSPYEKTAIVYAKRPSLDSSKTYWKGYSG